VQGLAYISASPTFQKKSVELTEVILNLEIKVSQKKLKVVCQNFAFCQFQELSPNTNREGPQSRTFLYKKQEYSSAREI
jgi:hypothetical protein